MRPVKLFSDSTSDLSEKLIKQLKVGGRMVIPLGNRASQVMTVIERTDEDTYNKTGHGNFIFVPLLNGTE